MEKRLLIFGLDCATPQLVFNEWLDDLPTIKDMMHRGTFRPLFSTIPPITVPAWMSMMTSKDGGQLGMYGFRNRKDHSYEALYTVNANNVKAKTLWNYLSRNRLSSLIWGIPLTYPPKPLNGMMVSSFLTPDKSVQWTYPAEAAAEIDAVADGDYIIDVKNFRTDDKDRLLAQIHLMTERRFKAFRHFYKKEEPDFAILVEMGIDRIHHGFWRYMDKTHRLYQSGNRYENAIHDYYVSLDKELARTLDLAPAGTEVMVVSDHGAKAMVGGFCINEWLQQEGYLTLKEQPAAPTKLKADMIDWSKTKAWGEGGYYSRIFMNVKGREPQGVIAQDDYPYERDGLIRKLQFTKDEKGENLGTIVYRPEEIYADIVNIPPDLIVHLGGLDWRSVGSVGVGTLHTFENDTGPDDANHAQEGIFITSIRLNTSVAQKDPYSIFDIAPTVLDYFGLEIPDDMIGESLLGGEFMEQPDQLADRLKSYSSEIGSERARRRVPGADVDLVETGGGTDKNGFADTGD
jgi:predicted AlkP superfamily phosphohydrolase/phosphomutase